MFRKFYYLLNSGKNSKLAYYVGCYARMIVPRAYCRWRMPRLLAEIEKRADRDYIQDRVDYYCRMDASVELPATAETLEQAWKRVRGGNVYQQDTYEYTRYFSPENRWAFRPGDGTPILAVPSITKSRPLREDNQNSILLNLNKIRHFIFLHDHKEFNDKLFKVIFKGKVTGKQSRVDFMERYFGNPLFDVGDVAKHPSDKIPMEWRVGKMTIREHLDYQFIMAIEGYDVASNLKWVMSSNSIAVMPRPTCETWFMEGRLVPNYHYIEVKPDFSDVEERVTYYHEYPDEAREIIRHAHEYVEQFKDKRREKLISLAVLNKYFGLVR